MSAVPHIVPSDISKVLHALRWKPRQLSMRYGQNSDYQPLKIGICVSGGSDSMALTYLLHNMTHPHSPTMKLFQSHAFVVDHAMRSGSAEEAAQVRQNLAVLGVKSSIIDVTAAERLGSSKELVAFKSNKTETNARAFRYQAIIATAQQMGISKLFLGHHHDDQMETLLMKMITQQTLSLSSFQGMPLISSAPHAIETFGFQHIGKSNTNYPHIVESEITIAESNEQSVEFVRPLLEFSKAQLVATCEYFRIPFVLDKTNLDPTHTLRNAIRYIRTHTKLPRALRDPNLTKLREYATKDASIERQVGREFSREIVFKTQHQQSGMIKIALSRQLTGTNLRNLTGAGFALARFCDLASPMTKDLLPSKLSPDATKSILGLLRGSNTKVSESEVGNQGHHQILKVDFRSIPPTKNTRNNELLFLQISRQPMRRSEIFANTHNISLRLLTNNDRRQSGWINWDNRFWIRAKPQDPSAFEDLELVLRPYQPEDVANTKKLLQAAGKENEFEKLLRNCAPGHVKFTMPVFALNKNIVCFPTCNFHLTKSLPFSWQVAFIKPQRAVDFFKSQNEW